MPEPREAKGRCSVHAVMHTARGGSMPCPSKQSSSSSPTHTGKTFTSQACPNNSLLNSDLTDCRGRQSPRAACLGASAPDRPEPRAPSAVRSQAGWGTCPGSGCRNERGATHTFPMAPVFYVLSFPTSTQHTHADPTPPLASTAMPPTSCLRHLPTFSHAPLHVALSE